MGNPYVSVVVTGYNTNPPADDGSQTEANRVKWSTIKTKLDDPLKTAIEEANTNTLAAFLKVFGGNGVTATAISYAVGSTDQGKLVRATGSGITITTPDATDVDEPFVFALKNASSGNITFDGNGSQTIDGTAALTLAAGEGVIIFTDGTNWFTIGRAAVSTLTTGFALINGSLAATVASSALTISIKDASGSDPTPGSPVYVLIRNATIGTGDFTLMAITAATSLVISSGSTMGATNSIAFRLWIVGFNDGGTFRLGAINCRNGINIYKLAPGTIASSTAEGGAGAADSAHVFYTGTAVTSKPYQILGYITYGTGLAAVGTWNVTPAEIQLYGLGVPLPGQTLQVQQNFSGAVAAGTTVLPNDDTIPQITEGIEFMTQAITPGSTATLLHIEHKGQYSGGAPIDMVVALFQDATANALAVTRDDNDTSTGMLTMGIDWMMLAGTVGATTFRIRAGSSTVGTITFNGSSSARKYGGAIASFLRITEIMA